MSITRRATLLGGAFAFALATLSAVSITFVQEARPSAAFPFEKKRANVLGSFMTYVDTGTPPGA